jgi:hypothetical protein
MLCKLCTIFHKLFFSQRIANFLHTGDIYLERIADILVQDIKKWIMNMIYGCRPADNMNEVTIGYHLWSLRAPDVIHIQMLLKSPQWTQ